MSEEQISLTEEHLDVDYQTQVRNSVKDLLRKFIKKEQNVNIIESNIYKTTFDTLLFHEDFFDIYKKNVLLIISELNEGKKTLNDILENIKRKKLNWEHEYLKDYILDEVEQNNFIMNPFEIEEGVLECKCGSKRVYSYQIQSRSSDEPMTTHAQCMACKSKWTYSG